MIFRLPFVLGGSVALAVVAVLFISMVRPARPPLIPKLPPFDARWQEHAPVTPKVIRTIPITAPSKVTPIEPELPPHRYVPPAPPRVKVAPKKRERYERPDRYERDICRGKGKRYTNNGRSWRCKR